MVGAFGTIDASYATKLGDDRDNTVVPSLVLTCLYALIAPSSAVRRMARSPVVAPSFA
jgi:hypothetical protein